MAIQQSMEFRGLPAPETYTRIERIYGGKREGWTALAKIHASAAKANPTPVKVSERQVGVDEDSKEPIMEDVMQTPPVEFLEEISVQFKFEPGVCPYQLGYAALKALSRFEGCTDV